MAKINLSDEQAVSIISEAKSAEAYDGEMPNMLSDREKVAEELTKYALEVYVNEHDRSDVVQAVLAIAGINVNEKTGEWEQLQNETEESEEAEDQDGTDYQEESASDEEEDQVEPQDKQEEEIIGKAKEEKRIKRLGLPIPEEVPEDYTPNIPLKLSELNDEQLKKAHSQFTACYASVNWQLAVARIDEHMYKELAEHRAIRNKRNVPKIDENTQKTRPAATIEREQKEAAEDEDVLEFRVKQGSARRTIIGLERLQDIYGTYLDSCSRQWSFRQHELTHSGNLR